MQAENATSDGEVLEIAALGEPPGPDDGRLP
jgi:hypothetical protein